VSGAQPDTRQTGTAASSADGAERASAGTAVIDGSKENEPVDMARAVKGTSEGQSRLGKPVAAKPPKPVTSSKVSQHACAYYPPAHHQLCTLLRCPDADL